MLSPLQAFHGAAQTPEKQRPALHMWRRHPALLSDVNRLNQGNRQPGQLEHRTKLPKPLQ